MSSTKAHQLARKYGKKFGGNLLLEGAVDGGNILNKIASAMKSDGLLQDLEGKVVSLAGYIENPPARALKTGYGGETIQTAYVTGLAIQDKILYAITADKVYRLHGPWYPDIIKGNTILNEMWEDVKKQVLDKSNK